MTNKSKKKLKKKNKTKIKTYKVQKGITKHFDESKVKSAISEMKKAKAVKVSNEEYQREISGKMVERVKLQKNYHGSYLFRRMKEERLRDMKERIKDAESVDKKEVEWLGFYYGFNHIKSCYDFELHEFRQLISNENYLKQALVNVGFDDGDLINVLNGRYIKDHEVLSMKEKRKNGKK